MKMEDILLDPGAHYATPAAVLADERLKQADRIQVLHRWEYDARQLMVAENEGMAMADVAELMEQIRDALEQLGAESQPE
jgi:pyridoxine/pyridoxamine 5'-phosphate oxidase